MQFGCSDWESVQRIVGLILHGFVRLIIIHDCVAAQRCGVSLSEVDEVARDIIGTEIK